MTHDTQPRVGIFSGTFDPVHSGHISFGLHAREVAQLDEVCFIPERKPRHKPGVEHFSHRVAMLRRAVKPYKDFSLLELVDRNFTVRRTLPRIRQVYPNAKLVMMMGSDTFHGLEDWPNASELLQTCEFVVGVRTQLDLAAVLQKAHQLNRPITVVDSVQPDVSSSQMRKALRLNLPVRGLLPSVRRYANQEWLYARLS